MAEKQNLFDYTEESIQETIIPKLVFEVFILEMKVLENLVIGDEGDEGTVCFSAFRFFQLSTSSSPYTVTNTQ